MSKKSVSPKQFIMLTIINTVLFFAMITVNALANILPINGLNTGELSALYPNLFVPAGLTFSIWGVIYLLLFIYIVNALVSAIKEKLECLDVKTQLAFAITCILNASWIISWHYKLILLSEFIMLALLVTLIYLFLKTSKLKTKGFLQTLTISAPINIYLGWITVATIANSTALFVAKNWGAWGVPENIWTITLILIAACLTVIMLFKRNNICFALVIIWALIGIWLKRTHADIIHKDIILTVSIAIGLLVILTIYTLIKRKSLSQE